MKRRVYLTALGLIVYATSLWGASNTVVVASWNVENLFDTEDDAANKGDDGYTPRGWSRWTPARYALKLEHLADVIDAMRPDVLCLVEIENRRVLEDLVRTLRARHHDALSVIVHREGDDKRGIDVAMVAVCAPVATNWLRMVSGQREVLACDFMFEGRPLTVLVNHWKSQLGKKEESDAIRRIEARGVRTFLDGRLKDDPSAAILVAGDFNDGPRSTILTEDAGFVADEQRVRGDLSGRLLLNLSGRLPVEVRGTYYYSPAKQWNLMDAMNVTPGMLEGATSAAPWRVRKGSYSVFKSQAQCSESGAPLPFRRVRNKEVGDVYLTGYSDHFPVRVELEVPPVDPVPGAKVRDLP
ncbi:MAG: endonuclease/exonuclease/phosphatase family protein [bacterium]